MFFSAGLLLIIVQQLENEKTTLPFVELTDLAESFCRLYLKCLHKQIAALYVKAAGCPMARRQNILPIAVQHRLNAEGMPLAHLLQTLGRYRHGHLGWHPEVATLSVMGAFPLNDTDRALELLQAALPVRVQRLTPWWVTVEPA